MASPLIDLASEIRSVTVYRQGASVVRCVTLELPEVRGDGRNPIPSAVRVVGLPLTLRDASVRAALRPGPGVEAGARVPIIGDLRVSLVAQSELDKAQDKDGDEDGDEDGEQSLRDERIAAQQAHDQARVTLASLRTARAALDSLRPGARAEPKEGEPPPSSPTLARLELLRFRAERSAAASAKIEVAEEAERRTGEVLGAAQERERVASSDRKARRFELRKAALLSLEWPAGEGAVVGSVELELAYDVPGARWVPAYVARLDGAMRAADFELRALVAQDTGEDWASVALTLSTASPQRWAELPELAALKIGRRQPPPAKSGWRPAPEGAAALYADYQRELGGGPRRMVRMASKGPPPPPAQSAAPASMAQPELGFGRGGGDGGEFEGDLSAFDDGPVAGSHEAPGASSREAAPPRRPMKKRSKSGAAKPRAQSLSAPMAPPMGGAASPSLVPPKGGGLLGAVASGATQMFGSGGAGYGGAPAEAAPEAAPQDLDTTRLDYGELHMPGALEASLRGELRQGSGRTLRGDWSPERVESSGKAAAAAAARARRVDLRKRAPKGHRWPVDEGGYDYAYVADGPTELASDGSFRALPILAGPAKARPRYVCVPRESADVFRIVTLDNPLKAPLLPGPVDVYVDGKYALSSAVERTPPGAAVELGLGVEPSIEVARNVRFEEDTTGMFKRSLELHHRVNIELHNHLRTPATVEVRERLPHVPEGSEGVELILGEVAPPWSDYEPRDEADALEAGRRWSVSLPPGERHTLRASYVITIPKDHELVGGNQRER